ncbi:MAG TPA: FAD-binding protein [Labilithrix sp.]|nr:FAD-binding protein [Labilithrix sp.]
MRPWLFGFLLTTVPFVSVPVAWAQLCPAVTPLTLSCGNGTCDVGESASSCVTDCEDPDTHAIGYYSEYSHCPQSLIYRPQSVAELQMAVRELVAQNLRVKFMGSGHSTAGNFCSDGGVIVTERLKDISEVEPWNGQDSVVVEAGVNFTELTNHLAARGKWLGYTVVGYGQINAVGAIATGVHGSNTHGTSSISSRILEIDMVRPDGTIVRKNASNSTSDEWRALRANLGALGGMARVRLAVDDVMNLRGYAEAVDVTSSIVSADIENLISGCDYVFLMFFPATDKWVRFCGSETMDPVTHPDAVNYLFAPDVTQVEANLFLAASQLMACTPSLEPTFEKLASERMAASPIMIPDGNGGSFRVNDAVVPGHRMLTIGRFPETQPRYSQYDFEFSVRFEHAAEILNYIDTRFDQAGRGMPLIGTVVRFDEVRDDTLFGVNAVRDGTALGDRIVHIEMPFYRPYGFSDAQLAAYAKPYYDIMEYVAARYPDAQFHFGKNTPQLFANAAHRANSASRLARFQSVVDAWDPYGVYANDYLRNLGITWRLDGERFSSVYIHGDVATSAYTQTASLFAIRSQSSKRCLTMIREPGVFLDGSIFGVHPGETRDCERALVAEDPRQRFFVRDVATGMFVGKLESGRRYSIHPEDSPYVECLDSLSGIDYRFAPCDGSTAQEFRLELDEAGEGRVVAMNNTLGGCMTDLLGSDAVSAGYCSPWGNPSNVRWKFEPLATRSMSRYAGVGGDPYWIDRLAIGGLDLSTVNATSLPALAVLVDDPGYIIYRQRVVDDTNGNPAAGFRVCSLGPDGKILHGADGRELACAYTDDSGYFTMLGLRQNVDVVNTIDRKGYLQNAIVFSTTYPGYFEQEYAGTSSLAAANLRLSVDPRFPYTSGFGLRAGHGDASLTVVNETDTVGSRGYGVVEAGDYAGNGTGGATFRLYSDDGSGTFSMPYRDLVSNRPFSSSGPAGIPDGLKYLGASTNVLLEGSAVPTNTRVDTYDPFGGALVLSMPAGTYEAEVLHPTLNCYPGLDAWPGSTSDRARFVVLEGHMSSVRFFCE